MEQDIALLRRYAETADEPAFAAVVERRIDMVYSAALRHLNGSVHRAQDVTQTVFTQLAANAKTLIHRDDLQGWLYVATHHAAANLKRTEARRQAREAEAQTMHISTDSQSAADWEQLRPVIDASLLELPEKDRQAILSRYFQNQRLAALGEQLGVSADAARMRLDRALEKLRTQLSGRGITSTSAALATVLSHQGAAAAPTGLAATVTTVALSGAGAAATAAATAGLLKAKTLLAVAAGIAVLGVSIYTLDGGGRRAQRATAADSTAPSRAVSALPSTAPERTLAAALPSPPPDNTMVLVGRSPGSSEPQVIVVDPQASAGHPQIVLSEVLEPNNRYHDARFGISMTVAEGWSVREARRWGDRNRHNTVVFSPAGAESINSTMYYKLFQPHEAERRNASAEAYLRQTAAEKEAARVGPGFRDYKIVPESFEFTHVNDQPCMTYFATFTSGDQVMTEYFVRLLGRTGYVTFFTTGPLEEVRPQMPRIKAMAQSVRLP